MQYSNPYIELCLEGHSSVFKSLLPKDKELIDKHHSVVIYKKNQLIIKDGEKTKGLIFLASGKVKIFKVGVGGREQIIRMVRQNGFIGYRALISESTHTVSAETLEESAVCIIEKGILQKIIKKNAELSYRFMKVVTEELITLANRTVSLTQKHIRGRVAESLLVLRDIYGLDADGKTIKVALSREDIASLSNMTTSNAIRTLSNLSAEGIIGIEGRKIRILDSKNLDRISELG
jgi:CRP-like cAMP-binding protein